MITKEKIINSFSWLVLLSGALVLGGAIFNFPLVRADSGLLLFVVVSIFFTTFLQIQLPRTTIHFTISDAIIFISLMIYGGEIGIILAAVESFYTSFTLKRKGVNIRTKTFFLNSAIATITTFGTVIVLRYFFTSISEVAQLGTTTEFVAMICLMVMSQFLFNSVFVSIVAAIRNNKPIYRIWYEYCFNGLIMFITSAFLAGVIVSLAKRRTCFDFCRLCSCRNRLFDVSPLY